MSEQHIVKVFIRQVGTEPLDVTGFSDITPADGRPFRRAYLPGSYYAVGRICEGPQHVLGAGVQRTYRTEADLPALGAVVEWTVTARSNELWNVEYAVEPA